MHYQFSKLILKNDKIKNIIEIGGSASILSDTILSNNSNVVYTIVEPNVHMYEPQKHIRKKIVDDFIENVDRSHIDKNDTLVLSHILEHFYEPKHILDKLLFNSNVKYFYLVWPDLDYYLKSGIVNILTIEHIYYVSTEFLIKLIESYGFVTNETIKFHNHSIFFEFERSSTLSDHAVSIPITKINTCKNSLDQSHDRGGDFTYSHTS
jgi:hypothetical protein